MSEWVGAVETVAQLIRSRKTFPNFLSRNNIDCEFVSRTPFVRTLAMLAAWNRMNLQKVAIRHNEKLIFHVAMHKIDAQMVSPKSCARIFFLSTRIVKLWECEEYTSTVDSGWRQLRLRHIRIHANQLKMRKRTSEGKFNLAFCSLSLSGHFFITGTKVRNSRKKRRQVAFSFLLFLTMASLVQSIVQLHESAFSIQSSFVFYFSSSDDKVKRRKMAWVAVIPYWRSMK